MKSKNNTTLYFLKRFADPFKVYQTEGTRHTWKTRKMHASKIVHLESEKLETKRRDID